MSERLKQSKLNVLLSKKSYIAMICIIVIQLGFIAYTNIFMIPNTLDNDAAKLFLHALEIWNRKQLFLPNWSNMTTLELDCSALLAMPIYGITKNVYLSFGLSNIIFSIVFIFVFLYLLGKLTVSIEAKLTAIIFMLIPFSFGQLLYYNMMFFAGGQYVIKVLVPLLFIIVLTSEDIHIGHILVGIVSVLLTFIMGISSGPYIFVTGVVPVALAYLVCTGIRVTKIKDFICIKVAYIATIGLAAAVGEIICLKKHVNTSGNAITLIPGKEIVSSFFSKISAFFELLGGYAYEPISILSIDGIVMSFKCIMALAIFIAIICSLVYIYKNKVNNEVITYVVLIILVNYMIVLFTDSFGSARYLLVFIVPSFLLVTYYWEKVCLGIKEERVKVITIFTTILLVIIELIVSDYQVLTNKSFPYFAHENSKYVQIVDFVNEQPEDHVFVINDNGQPEVYRIFDLYGTKEYLVYLTETNTIEVHDYYWSDEYYNWLNDGFLLVGCDSNTSIEMMPEDIVNRSEKIGGVQNYSVYRIHPN